MEEPTSSPTMGRAIPNGAGGTMKKVKKEERTPQALLNVGSLPLEDRFEWAGRNVMVERAGTPSSSHELSSSGERKVSKEGQPLRDAKLLQLMARYSHANWMPDEETNECLQCHKEFTISFRRHHCRSCGLIFCSLCTPNSITLLDKGYRDNVRVCDACHKEVTEYLQAKYAE